MTRVLDVSGLEGGYDKVQIMNGVDLYVDEGEFVTVIGPNGCGKSTFIKIVFGIATYYSGSVKHKGHEISGWRGMFPILFSDNVSMTEANFPFWM